MSLIQRISSIFKSKDIEISGIWNGHYGFGEPYSETVRKKTVQFTAEISSEDNGYFTGTIKESDEGIPEISRMEGRIRGNKIVFEKTYKKSYQIDETGKLYSKHGPQHVNYNGVYIQSRNVFSGQWIIKSMYVFDDGRKQEHVSLGNWSMEKE